ncbi:MAG: hypothetical protein P4L84_09460 [Isosphaeraceae bacterium]|nr:hypothetical protein [Isosphaeraceae bacterium]
MTLMHHGLRVVLGSVVLLGTVGCQSDNEPKAVVAKDTPGSSVSSEEAAKTTTLGPPLKSTSK